MKKSPPFNQAVIVLNPKIDSKHQRRLQCSLRFDDIFKCLASESDFGEQAAPELWGVPCPTTVTSGPRQFHRPAVQPAPDRVNPAGLAKMERMLELAEAAGRLKAWGRALAGLAPAITPRLPVRQAGTRTLPLPWAELLTDAERIKDFPAAYLEVCRHGEVVNFEPSE
jgi:hypothetical protein